MSTNWQEPHGAAPPPPPKNHPNPKRRFAIVGILLVVIAGLAAAAGLVLVNRGGDDVADEAQYVVMDSPTVTPVFEPRDARGNDPFFPLETQLLTFQQEVEEEIQDMVDEQVMAAEASGDENVTIEVPSFDVAELDAAVKTGLYGGTEENTCDPERLISFLIANPEIGEAWAAVQGIPFSAIPAYIRSLEVRVLAEPVNVLNHGYDPVSGAAYEIDAVLDAGTAVLVDADGDIRTRCYCGNPIKPKPPVGHMPPRCIVFGASVFIVPGGGATRDDAPGDVLLTGQETTLASGALWIEVKWGNNDDQKGWVAVNNLRKHYCPPPEVDVKCPGPETTDVYANDRTTVVGQVTGTLNTPDGPEDIFGPIDPVGFPGDETITDNFLLIHFTQAFPSVNNSGWVNLDDLQNDDCFEIPMCIDLQDNFVRDRAGGAILDATLTGKMSVRFTGHFAGAPGDWAEVDILDGSGRTGWIPTLWMIPLADDECVDEYNDCIYAALIFADSNGGDVIGWIANGRVQFDDPPIVENDRIRIHTPDGPTGWIEVGDTMTPGWDDCISRWCYQLDNPAFEIFKNAGASVGGFPDPLYLDHHGIYLNDGGLYERIGYLGDGYWAASADLIPLALDRCDDGDLTPECPEFPYNTPVDGFAPNPFGVVSPDLASQMPEPMDPDDSGIRTQVCCVTELFIAPGGALAPADEYPAFVTVFDTQNILGIDWFQTTTGRWFTIDEVDFSERACQAECPDPQRIPGISDVLRPDELDEDGYGTVTAGLTILPPGGHDDPIDPIDPSGDCCVRFLYFDSAGAVPVPVVGPFMVEVEAGPLDGGWYRTTTGRYFHGDDVLDASNCDGPVNCPTSVDDVPERFPGEGDKVFLASTYLPEALEECCVDGDYFDDANGALMGTWDEPTKVAILDSNGDWYLVGTTDSMPALAVWVPGSAFVDISECDRDDVDPGCPDFSLIRIDDEGRQVCCVADDNGGFLEVTLTGTVAFIGPDLSFETVELGFIEGDRFVGAGRCDPNDDDANCPTLSIISALNPNECCVASAAAGPFIVEITGETRDIGGGVLEYNTVDHGWILESQFVFSGDCELDPCPNGQLIDGVCCERGQELFAGQCTDPCPTGSTRNPNTGRCVFPQPEPEPEPEPEPQPEPEPVCPSGLIDNAGNCCQSGQALVNGVCVNPCDLFGGDVDEDGICGDEDPCPRDPTNTCQTDPCLDLGGDTDGDQICDQRDECPNDPTNDCLNPCPGTRDSDGDGICDPNDVCPDDPFNYCDNSSACVNGPGDLDKDGVCDALDNCPTVPNPTQEYPFQGVYCEPPLTFAPGTGQTVPPSN